jgi:Type II secretion system (T2SS), protein E, N-terminal domain
MPLSEIAQALVRRGVITRDAASEAEQRKKLYGGGLDTALLELRATDEETLISHLAEIIGIPLASPSTMTALPNRAANAWMDGATAQKLGAAPRAMQGDVLDVLVRPEHDHDALVAWAEQRSLLIEPALVCELRFRAHVRALYDTPMPPRYLALFAKLVGTAQARAAAGDSARDMRTPTPVVVGLDPVETLLAAARLGDASARRTALRRLSRRVHDPRVIAFRHMLEKKAAQGDPINATGALRALAELRDKNAVPALTELLEATNPDIATAAHDALMALCCDDAGTRSKRWLDWWARMGSLSRVEWLLEALAHRNPELRLLASTELYEISGEYFGYHYDLPERDREEARQRWIAWWQSKNQG